MLPTLFLFASLTALLTPGESASAVQKPSNLADYYYIQGSADNPYTWSCKSGQPLLYGRLNSPSWDVYAEYSSDDFHCLSQLVYGSTKASDYTNHNTLMRDTYNAIIPLQNYRSKKLVKSTVLGHKLIKTHPTLVRNRHNRTQEGLALGYSESVTSTSQVTVGFTASVSASAKFGIPFVGETEVKVEAGASRETSESTSTTKTIEAPAQKITLDPNTQSTVIFRFYETDLKDDYELEFYVDPVAATFKTLKEQIEKGSVKTKLSRGDGPYLRLENGKWIAGGFKASQTYSTHASKVEFGPPLPITLEDFELWHAPQVPVQDL